MRTSFLVELMVVSVIIGIVAAVSIPRFIGSQDRAKIAAAESDVTRMRDALGLYIIDWATYATSIGVSSTDYNEWKASVVDKQNNAYLTLPDTFNFDPSTFMIMANEGTFTISVEAKDSKNTTIYGNPEKTWIGKPE